MRVYLNWLHQITAYCIISLLQGTGPADAAALSRVDEKGIILTLFWLIRRMMANKHDKVNGKVRPFFSRWWNCKLVLKSNVDLKSFCRENGEKRRSEDNRRKAAAKDAQLPHGDAAGAISALRLRQKAVFAEKPGFWHSQRLRFDRHEVIHERPGRTVLQEVCSFWEDEKEGKEEGGWKRYEMTF